MTRQLSHWIMKKTYIFFSRLTVSVWAILVQTLKTQNGDISWRLLLLSTRQLKLSFLFKLAYHVEFFFKRFSRKDMYPTTSDMSISFLCNLFPFYQFPRRLAGGYWLLLIPLPFIFTVGKNPLAFRSRLSISFSCDIIARGQSLLVFLATWLFLI